MRKFQTTTDFRAYVPLILICTLSLTLYLTLIFSYPTVYWYDPHIRLALRNQLLLGHWLPLLQSLIVLVSKISTDLILLRSILALIAICTVAGMFFFTRQLFSDLTAFIAAMFLAFNMMFVALAIVPYPEVIFLGLCLASLVLLERPVFSPPFYFGVLALNLACLTRYEGWILSAMFVLESAFKLFATINWKGAFWSTIKVALLLGIGPIAWLFWGFPESGNIFDRLKSIVAFEVMTSVIQLPSHLLTRLNFPHIQEFSGQYFDLLVRQLHPEFVILAVLGILLALLNRQSYLSHVRILLFLLLDWILLAFFQPWGFGNLRQPFVLEVFLIPYAAYGLQQSLWWLSTKLSTIRNWKKILDWNLSITVVVTLAVSAWLARSAFTFVAASSRQADFLGPFEVAQWLNSHLKEEDTILVIDDNDEYYPYALATYIKYPFENILDDRLSLNLVQEKLEVSHMVYVVEFYESRTALSPAELRVVDDLENARVHGEHFLIDSIDVWYVPANQLSYLP